MENELDLLLVALPAESIDEEHSRGAQILLPVESALFFYHGDLGSVNIGLLSGP